MRIHLIAIGGKVMHNLALELAAQGHTVSGSDDEIYDPARSRLDAAGLLPEEGWNPDRITSDIDLIVLGMHAHLDNPELAKAKELHIDVVSFPEYVGRYSTSPTKVVIAGSHGKSTTTAMIMHALKTIGLDADYLLGGLLDGFDRMVRLSGAPVMVIEGDEYLSSRVDPQPKMLHYHGQIVVITGVEWDHKNVFPTEENYVSQFDHLISQCADEDTSIIWFGEDEHLQGLMKKRNDLSEQAYDQYHLQDGQVTAGQKLYPLHIFGDHNMANLKAAALVCEKLGIQEADFLSAMSSFKGVGKRLELISRDPIVYLDYAHAPSKVRATVRAVRSAYTTKKILAIYELHTYSSLSEDFLPQYEGTLDEVDDAIVYFDHHALKMKRLPDLDNSKVQTGFANDKLRVISDQDELQSMLIDMKNNYDVILLMSSGTFGGLDLDKIRHA